MEYKTQPKQQILDFMVENPDRIFKASEIAKKPTKLWHDKETTQEEYFPKR